MLRAANDRVQLGPDLRIRAAIELVFRKFREVGSIRQVLIWLRQEQIELPSIVYGAEGRQVVWNLPGYHALNKMLRNPAYGGAYPMAAPKLLPASRTVAKRISRISASNSRIGRS